MRVLVVEDHPPTRELLERSLSAAGFEARSAATLAQGLDRAREGPFDVLVLDVMLPDGDGYALCRALRTEGVLTPILFLTARGEVEDRIRGLDAGGDDYLRKPFALAELHARLRALGRRQGVAPPSQLRSGDTFIDFTARRMMRAGAEVPLTAREWAVLEMLAARPGRVVSRDELLEAHWGDVSEAAAESLAVIVSRLRRKLAASAGCSVQTVRGSGYRLDVER